MYAHVRKLKVNYLIFAKFVNSYLRVGLLPQILLESQNRQLEMTHICICNNIGVPGAFLLEVGDSMQYCPIAFFNLRKESKQNNLFCFTIITALFSRKETLNIQTIKLLFLT
jgi:hypothetical protein